MKEEIIASFEKQIDRIRYIVDLHFSTNTKETLVDKCKKTSENRHYFRKTGKKSISSLDKSDLEIPPKISVSSFMGYLKGKSSTILYEQFGELKYKYRNREFWCRGYYVDTVGKNTSRIAEYIQNQLKEDQLAEQLTLPVNGPFTGGK